MEYTIHPVSNGVLVAKMTLRDAKLPYYITIAVCFLISAFGGYKVYSSGLYQADNTSILAFLVGGLFCIGTFISSFFVRHRLSRLPDSIFFNNDRAMIEIAHEASAARKIEIPYQEIESIGPRRVSAHDGKKTRVWYALALKLRDGSTWDLIEDSILSESSAINFAEKILNNISLGKVALEKPVLPSINRPEFSIIDRGEETQVRWNNNMPNGSLQKIYWNIFFLGIASFISVSIAYTDESNWTALVILLKASLTDFSKFDLFLQRVDLWFIMCGGAFTVLVLMLIYRVFSILKFRFTTDSLVINRSIISSSSKKFQIPFSAFDTVKLTYFINGGMRDLDLIKLGPKQDPKSAFLSSDLDFDSVPSMISKSFEAFSRKGLSKLFSPIEGPTDKVLATLPFDKLSPLDVYVIKERIREKMPQQIMEEV